MTITGPRTTPTGHQAAPAEFLGLTGLRIVAALWVVAFHAHFTALPAVQRVDRLLGPLVSQGALGVDLFFVLSGFVLTHSWLDRLGPALSARVAGRFVWARVCRMWPAYLLVMHVFGLWLVARLLLGHDRDVAYQAVQPVVDVPHWAAQLLLVQLWGAPYLDGTSWVGPTWSLSAEWLAYLLFPLTALLLWRLRRLPAPVLAAAAVVVMVPSAAPYALVGQPYYPFSWVVRIGCGFAAGALAGLALRRARGGEGLRRGASVLAAAAPLLVAGVLVGGEAAGPGRGGVVVVTFPLLVAAVAVADRGPALLLARPWAVRGGRASYCLYLVHIPLLEVYWTALDHHLLGPRSGLVAGAAVLALALVAAERLHRAVEEPARRWLGERGPGRTPGRHAVTAVPRPRVAGAEVTVPVPAVGGPYRTARSA